MVVCAGCSGLDRSKSNPFSQPLDSSISFASEFEDQSQPQAQQEPEQSSPESEPTVRFQDPNTLYASIDPVTSVGHPIDFPTVLQIAGADNLNVKIAQERVAEASARYCEAKHAWLPTITLNIGYNNHEGEIQATEGEIIQVSRNSLFIGAGAGISDAPLNGGAGGPPRAFVDFSFADAIFKPLAAKRLLGASESSRSRVINDTLLQASLAYFDLFRAQSQITIAQTNLSEATDLYDLTNAFVEAGKGTASDLARIAVVVNNSRAQLGLAESELKIASTKLAKVLQLDPTKLNPETGLVALDTDPVAINLVDLSVGLSSMIHHAKSHSCEIAEANSYARAEASNFEAEKWRPFLPNLFAGFSGGLFGGGPGGGVSQLDGRTDLDLVLSWQLENLGFGSRAKQDAARSRVYQRSFESKQMGDQIAELVSIAYERVKLYQSAIGVHGDSVNQAGEGLSKNLLAIRELEGMPIEALNSLEQLAQARLDYLAAVTNFNQWQLRLLRATGQSLSHDVGVVQGCNPCGETCDRDCPSCVPRPPHFR